MNYSTARGAAECLLLAPLRHVGSIERCLLSRTTRQTFTQADYSELDPQRTLGLATFRLVAVKASIVPERRTEKSANQAIHNPQKQIISRHGRVPPNDNWFSRAVLGGTDIYRSTRVQVLLWRANDFGFGATMD